VRWGVCGGSVVGYARRWWESQGAARGVNGVSRCRVPNALEMCWQTAGRGGRASPPAWCGSGRRQVLPACLVMSRPGSPWGRTCRSPGTFNRQSGSNVVLNRVTVSQGQRGGAASARESSTNQVQVVGTVGSGEGVAGPSTTGVSQPERAKARPCVGVGIANRTRYNHPCSRDVKVCVTVTVACACSSSTAT